MKLVLKALKIVLSLCLVYTVSEELGRNAAEFYLEMSKEK